MHRPLDSDIINSFDSETAIALYIQSESALQISTRRLDRLHNYC